MNYGQIKKEIGEKLTLLESEVQETLQEAYPATPLRFVDHVKREKGTNWMIFGDGKTLDISGLSAEDIKTVMGCYVGERGTKLIKMNGHIHELAKRDTRFTDLSNILSE